MEQEEGREMPDGVESQTGYCRFCGQAGMGHTLAAILERASVSVTPPRSTQKAKSGSKKQRAA